MISVRQTKVFLSVLLLAALCLALIPASALGQYEDDEEKTSESPHAAGELIVTYEDDASETSYEPPEEAAVEVELPGIGAEVVGLSSVSSEKEVQKKKLASLKRELERKPNVASVEYNYQRRISYTANDPGLDDQWGLGKAGFERAWNGERGEGVKIAVLDTGISAGHPDIRGKISAQRDFLDGDQSADDTHGHGTAVAGIAAARTDNGTGIAGACPDCQLLVGKVMDGDGIGYDSDIPQAITWSVDSGADVVNLSLGGTADSTILKQAVDYAVDKGVVVVAAMGNQGTNSPEYPAAYPSVVAVASTDRGDERAYNSNFGEWVDVAAPGVEIASTVPGGYSVWSGTSMAAPHVSAEAALLSASGMNSGSIKSRISKTAQDLGFGGRDPYYGAGRIDAGSLARTDNPPKPVKTAAAPASKNLAKNAQTSRKSTKAKISQKTTESPRKNKDTSASPSPKPVNSDKKSPRKPVEEDKSNVKTNTKTISRELTELPDTGGLPLAMISGLVLVLLGVACVTRPGARS